MIELAAELLSMDVSKLAEGALNMAPKLIKSFSSDYKVMKHGLGEVPWFVLNGFFCRTTSTNLSAKNGQYYNRLQDKLKFI